MDNKKIPSKPKHPGYHSPIQCEFKLDEQKFRLDDGDDLSSEFLNKLSDLSDQGYIIHINIDHSQGYRDESCEIETTIWAYLPDIEAYTKAKDIYDEKLRKYNKEEAAYNAYLKEEAKRILTKEEQDAKKKRRAEYLKLKEEFEGK